MLKKMQAEAYQFLAAFLMFLCLMTSAHAAFAEGASENTVKVNGDKYSSGKTYLSTSTPNVNIPSTTDKIVGGLVTNQLNTFAVVGGQSAS